MEHQRPRHESNPDREARLLEGLRAHPELMARFESILGLSEVAEGPLRTADEIEAQLIEEVRRLGHEVMQGWAVGAEARVADELTKAHPGARVRKKKS